MSQLLTPGIGNTKSATALASLIFTLNLTLIYHMLGVLPKFNDFSNIFGITVLVFFETAWVLALLGPHFFGSLQEQFIRDDQTRIITKTARKEFYYPQLRDGVIAEFIFGLTVVSMGFLVMTSGRLLIASFTNLPLENYNGPNKRIMGWVIIGLGLVVLGWSIFKTDKQSKYLLILAWVYNLRSQTSSHQRATILEEIDPYLSLSNWPATELVLNTQLLTVVTDKLHKVEENFKLLRTFLDNYNGSIGGFFELPRNESAMGLQFSSFQDSFSFLHTLSTERTPSDFADFQIVFGREIFPKNVFAEDLRWDLQVIRWLDELILRIVLLCLIAALKAQEPEKIVITSDHEEFNLQKIRPFWENEEQGSLELFILSIIVSDHLLSSVGEEISVEESKAMILKSDKYFQANLANPTMISPLVQYFIHKTVEQLSSHIANEKLDKWLQQLRATIKPMLDNLERQISNPTVPAAIGYFRKFRDLQTNVAKKTIGESMLAIKLFRMDIEQNIRIDLNSNGDMLAKLISKTDPEVSETDKELSLISRSGISAFLVNLSTTYVLILDGIFRFFVSPIKTAWQKNKSFQRWRMERNIRRSEEKSKNDMGGLDEDQ